MRPLLHVEPAAAEVNGAAGAAERRGLKKMGGIHAELAAVEGDSNASVSVGRAQPQAPSSERQLQRSCKRSHRARRAA